MPKILPQYKSRIYLIIEQILAFTSRSNMDRGVKKISLNFKQIA